jgi:hypothetical protein
MAPFLYPKYPSDAVQGFRPESPGRFTVHGIFLRHRHLFAGLPGETSHFDQSDFGYEWRCEFEIGACPPTVAQADMGHSLQLHFSLMDIDRQSKPIAVLHLIEHGQEQDHHHRLLLPLEDLTETHEKLNQHLAQKEASIEVFENANRFIAALTKVRESLDNELVWD